MEYRPETLEDAAEKIRGFSARPGLIGSRGVDQGTYYVEDEDMFKIDEVQGDPALFDNSFTEEIFESYSKAMRVGVPTEAAMITLCDATATGLETMGSRMRETEDRNSLDIFKAFGVPD